MRANERWRCTENWGGEARHAEKKMGSGRCRERQHEIVGRERKKKVGSQGVMLRERGGRERDGVNNEQRGAKQHAMDL